jgi:hypothetical protein
VALDVHFLSRFRRFVRPNSNAVVWMWIGGLSADVDARRCDLFGWLDLATTA